MHNPAFAAHALDFAYVPLHVSVGQIKAAMEGLRALNFRGANVTLPHKQAVIPYLDSLSPISRMMGAVNTIVNDGGKLHGTTTDPVGFLTGFREAGFDFAGKSIAIIGNGGSARTLAFALLTQDKPSRVILVARNGAKASSLVEEIAAALAMEGHAAKGLLEAVDLNGFGQMRRSVDVLVNATPVGMHPKIGASPIEPDWLEPHQVVYDIVYVPEETKLIMDARARGLKTVGGLGMLVHQGCASFELWTGVKPDPALFYRHARQRLAQSAAQKSGPTSRAAETLHIPNASEQE